MSLPNPSATNKYKNGAKGYPDMYETVANIDLLHGVPINQEQGFS